MNLIDLIYYVPQFLTHKQCDFLIEEHKKRENECQLEHCPEATTGIDTYSSFKMVSLTKNTEAFRIVHSATEEMINQYHDYLDTFDAFHILRRTSLMYSHVYRLLKYEVGAKIHPHVDHDPYVYGSCTFNLNDDYTGGDFVFFKGKHRIKMGKGDAMIWPADYFWVHEVEEITSGNRYSTNSFLQAIPQSVKVELNSFIEKRMRTYNMNPQFQDGTKYNVRGY